MAVRFKIRVAVACLMAGGCFCLRMQAGQEETSKPAQPARASAAQEDEGKKPAARVSVSAVFSGGTQFIDAAKETCQDLRSEKLQDCFALEMKKAKASPEAVEFSKELGEPGFVRDFKVAGPVDIAYVLYPYRANENQSCLIVNGNPASIDVDNHKLVAADGLQRNAMYLTLAKAHKDVSLWPGDRYETESPDVEMGANAGVHIIVNYRLREECHACVVLGHAWYSFDFDPKGKFGGASLIGVSIAREKAAVVRETNKPVVVAVDEEVTIALPVKPAAESEWVLAKGLATDKVRLIEHSHVAPPSETGGAGTDELWKFAALGAGTTEIEFQKATESGKAAKPVTFRVVVRGGSTGGPGKAPPAKN